MAQNKHPHLQREKYGVQKERLCLEKDLKAYGENVKS